ncbi:hypothetical protein JXA80_02300, partial [bacterium]|nr:hypothetical protein [candidate division CSSED10-310 bacterium]
MHERRSHGSKGKGGFRQSYYHCLLNQHMGSATGSWFIRDRLTECPGSRRLREMLAVWTHRHGNESRPRRREAWITLLFAVLAMVPVSLFAAHWLFPSYPGRLFQVMGGKPGLDVTRFKGEQWQGPSQRSVVIPISQLQRPDDTILEGSHFSLEMTGYLYLPANGSYHWTVASDDGVYLWIDEALILSDPGYHPAREIHHRFELTRGWKKIKIRYFNGTADAGMRLEWQPPGRRRSVIGPGFLFRSIPEPSLFRLYRLLLALDCLENQGVAVGILLLIWSTIRFTSGVRRVFRLRPGMSCLAGGLLGVLVFLLFATWYFLPRLNPVSQGFTTRIVRSLSGNRSVDGLQGNRGRLNSVTEPSFRFDHVEMVFHAWLMIDEAGDYGFSLQADDNAVLSIDGRKVLTSSIQEQFRFPVMDTIYLSTGLHELNIEYANLGGNSYLDLKWSPPGMRTMRPIPRYRLFPFPPTPEEKRAVRQFHLQQTMAFLVLSGLIGLMIVGLGRIRSSRVPIVDIRMAAAVAGLLFLASTHGIPDSHRVGLQWFTQTRLTVKILIGLGGFWLVSGMGKPSIRWFRGWIRRSACPGIVPGVGAMATVIVGKILLSHPYPEHEAAGVGLFCISAVLIWIAGLKPVPARERRRNPGPMLNRRVVIV